MLTVRVKSFFKNALVFCSLVLIAPSVRSVEAGWNLGAQLPVAPAGVMKRAVNILAVAGIAGVVGALVSLLLTSQSERPLKFIFVGSAILGALYGASCWDFSSPQGCLNALNSVYNEFLVNPVLAKDLSLSVLLEEEGLGSDSSDWIVYSALFKVGQKLNTAKKNLVLVINYAQMLREAPLIQSMGDDTVYALSAKISVLKGLLELAKTRYDLIVKHPAYELQLRFENRYENLKKNTDASDQMFQDLWNIWYSERMMQHDVVEDVPEMQLPFVDADVCSLCKLSVMRNRRYTTVCGCAQGRHFYHHGCIVKSLREHGNFCARCSESATVHSAFGDLFVPVVTSQFQQSQQQQVHQGTPRSRCALCSGVILRNKAYKTSCVCAPGAYFYHHECIKTHLNHDLSCPKCHVKNPTVHSDFADGFVPGIQVNQQLAPRIVPPVRPTAPVMDVLNTCALCSGNIVENKRYRTGCNCPKGAYYYHHLCISDTLKKNGYRCPKCSCIKTTVHSAF